MCSFRFHIEEVMVLSLFEFRGRAISSSQSFRTPYVDDIVVSRICRYLTQRWREMPSAAVIAGDQNLGDTLRQKTESSAGGLPICTLIDNPLTTLSL